MFAIKLALKLNNKEKTLMAKHAGFRRFVYNFGLSLRQQMYGESKLSDAKVIASVKKVLTNHLKKQPEYAWMDELSSKVYQSALQDLQTAFSRYRKGISIHPQFASKRDKSSFTVYDSNGKFITTSGSKLKIPTLGTFRLHEKLEHKYVTQTLTIAKEANNWFVSFNVDADRLPVDHKQDTVGIDLGVKAFATLSNAETFDAPKPLKQAKTKLAQLQRKASKQTKGSKNQQKTYSKISQLHYQVSSIRKDFLQKLTTYIAKTFEVIKIEDLNISGMLANHKLAGAIADLGFYEFRRQLQYKCNFYGSNLVLVNSWFPSSKLCSDCGHKQDMPLQVRIYDCSNCGVSIDRDLNASLNILKYEPLA